MPVPYELIFAQRFPFSSRAVKIAKESDFSLDNAPQRAIDRAKAMVLHAGQGKEYFLPKIAESSDTLKDEIIAFPLAKIFLSLIRRGELNKKFSRMFSDSAFKYLQLEAKADDFIIDLAKELKIKFKVSNKKEFFAEIDLLDYLKASFSQEFMKLVNQRIKAGNVFLNRNDFMRFEAALVYNKILSSLPVDTKVMPKKLKKEAEEIAGEIFKRTKREFVFTGGGKIDLNYFPPCFSLLYDKLTSGEHKLHHLENFDLGCFLVNLRMPEEEILKLYARSPNFNERLVRYHIKNIKGTSSKPRYSSPSCSKMVEHKLCRRNDSCEGIKTPLGYYIRDFKAKK